MNPIIEAAKTSAFKSTFAAVFAAAIGAGKSVHEADDRAFEAASAASDAVVSAAEPQAIKAGAHHCGDGSTVVWAVYSRAAVEAYLGTEVDTREAAEALTGWHSYYSGAGRGFAHDPYVKAYGRKILVKQFRGLDF